jgi:lipopolysaccharide export system protein LptA
MMAGHTIKALALRSLLGGFAIGTAAMLSIGQTGAQSFGGHSTDAPVNFGADRIELQDRQDRVVLAGNVDIAQGDLRLQAARTTLAYSDAGELKLHRIDATGGVNITRGSQTASGAVAIYDLDRRIITLAGNVALRRGGDTLSGGRLVIDLDSGVASIDGRASGGSSAIGSSANASSRGRVTGTFSVPKRSN